VAEVEMTSSRPCGGGGPPSASSGRRGHQALDELMRKLIVLHRLLEAEERLPEREPWTDPHVTAVAPSALLLAPAKGDMNALGRYHGRGRSPVCTYHRRARPFN
jgi:hypothetical protein